MKRLTAAVLASALALGQAQAGTGTITVKDAGGTTRTFDVVTDGSGNFNATSVICDQSAAANCAGVNSSHELSVSLDGGSGATVAATQSGTWNVTVSTALPAGSNQIGTVNPATAATWGLAAIGGTSSSPTNALAAGCQYNSSPPTFSSGDAGGIQCTAAGSVHATVDNSPTVQPGNTPNTTPWLVSVNQGGNSAAVKAASTSAAQSDAALVVRNADLGTIGDSAWISGNGTLIAVAKAIAGNTAAAIPDCGSLPCTNKIGALAPLTATSAQVKLAVTTGGTFQQALASATGRKGCTIQFITASHTGYVFFGSSTPSDTSTSFQLSPGQSLNCGVGSMVLTDQVLVTSSNNGDVFVVNSQ